MHTSIKPSKSVTYEVLHEDNDLLVVDKPSGRVTQPGKKHAHDSLLNGLFVRYGNRLQNLGEARNWGLLHRLDKPTSGVVIVALQNRAYDDLRSQFENRRVKKMYWAVVAGCPRVTQGVIQHPIAEVVGARKKAVVKRTGKQAITAYRVIEVADDVALIEARPKTGRLHQIRVHMASLGHPVLGEPLYARGLDLPSVPRLCLHAAAISFRHPTTEERLTVTSPLPTDLLRALKRFHLTAPEP